jgi:ATP-dependent Clp protease ATP-binding subunit ClpX
MLSSLRVDPVENLKPPLSSGVEQFLKFVQALPLPTPHEIFSRLEELGYRGQEPARQAVALMAYRHVRRIKRIFLQGMKRDEVMGKSNTLFIGPTGCGKTHLVELLFRHILKLPTVVVDITTYSETGYVGQDPNTILTRLLYVAEGNPLIAAIGIVCLDEFDKLASGQNNAVFAGAGTTKDVTGLGVQRELLKMLEASEVVVPMELSHSTYGEFIMMSTADLAFIAVGAFSGFPQLLRWRGRGDAIGFGRTPTAATGAREDAIAVTLRPEEVEDISHFQAYGFLPELIARFTRIVPFEALSKETLKKILFDAVVRRMESEFAEEGLKLILEDEVLDWVVGQSIRRQTGARGLSSILTRLLEQVAFDSFAGERRGTVRVILRDGQVVVEPPA